MLSSNTNNQTNSRLRCAITTNEANFRQQFFLVLAILSYDTRKKNTEIWTQTKCSIEIYTYLTVLDACLYQNLCSLCEWCIFFFCLGISYNETYFRLVHGTHFYQFGCGIALSCSPCKRSLSAVIHSVTLQNNIFRFNTIQSVCWHSSNACRLLNFWRFFFIHTALCGWAVFLFDSCRFSRFITFFFLSLMFG